MYDNNIINLSVGAPGPDLLANCCEIFNEATKHRLVSHAIRENINKTKMRSNQFVGFRALKQLIRQRCFNMVQRLVDMILEIHLLDILPMNIRTKFVGECLRNVFPLVTNKLNFHFVTAMI